MRIAIDFTPAIAQSAGIARYTRDLVNALARLDTTDRFTLFSAERPTKERPIPEAATLHPRVVPLGNRNMTILWQRLRAPIPIELLVGPVRVFHGPDFIQPPALRARRVVTIHDLAFLTHPECAVPSLVRYLSAVVPRAVRAADRVIAVSRRTADDLVERLGVSPAKIDVIHLGISPVFTPQVDREAVAALREKYRLDRPFVLAVGTIEPRKNYEALIHAFAAARRAPSGPQLLVIAGKPGWLYEGVYKAVEAYGLADAVRFLSYVPEGELPPLYHAAAALAMPSIYEGFGIPVVEAMASGVPVVCSTGGSLAEIAGDAALLVAPEDSDGLAAALVRIMSETSLSETLRTRGLERAAHFTWAAAARAHIATYHAAAQSGAVRTPLQKEER
jgi:glycosyltransferase involved in cell wall biosynthesis